MAGTVGGNNQSYQILYANLQTAFVNPLPERCALLTQLLLESPVKELQYIFPSLIENIFGFRSGTDWGLLSLDCQIKDFDYIKKFLSPDGPLFKLIYKLLEDFSPKFEFSITCLPFPSQLMLKEGKVPALYANKFQVVNPGLFSSTVQLNAFEFYCFHFAYYIINSSLRSSLSTVNQQDTLYAHLLEDYLFYFLPTDGRAVPLYQSPHNIQHSPILTSSLSSSYGSPHGPDTLYSKSLARPDCLTPMRPKHSLLKRGAVMMVASSGSNTTSSQTECWKSETFLLILKEMYLNQNSIDHHQNLIDLSMKTFVPSHYHVWMVRILIKHLHFFFNNSLTSNSISSHGQIMIDSLGRLKSLGMTQLIQKEVYCFLKSTFDHWPLDASFRVPLETWLSYIQPWRYTQCDFELNVWQKFVNENVLFYTSMFQQVLRRFLRMDFNCPKNAYMLYRVTKVFSMRDVREMVMQAEKSCVSKPSGLAMSTSYIHRSPEKSYSFRKVSHLESPVANYIPLFSEQVFLMVTHLLSAIVSAQEKAEYCGGLNQSIKNQSLFFKVFHYFDISDEAYNSDENSPADIKKVSAYLETSLKQLCSFFKEVNPPVMNTVNTEKLSPSVSNTTAGALNFDDRFQLLNKKKKLDVTYYGNPDLQPVRTYEVARLVSLLNELSQQLNEKYASEIHRLYHQPTILGKVCRRILAKPVTFYNIVKSSDMQSVSRNPVHLPPRIHLRFLANKQLITYFFVLLLIAYWIGYHPVFFSLLLFYFMSLIIFFVAILYPVHVETKQN